MLTSDEKYMQRCLQLAAKGEYYVAPNPMVGAVLVAADGTILGEGWHKKFGGPHAEVNAFADYDMHGERHTCLAEATLYVSLEPCSHYGKTPPCADMIIRRGVGRVVVGCIDPNPQVATRGIRRLQDAGIEVVVGVMEKECRELNRRFICLQEKHRPYVILKWAQTADGFIAPLPKGDGEQPRLVLSSVLTKMVVHRMRAENMAIMVGTNTVIFDNPKLLTTHWSGRNPIRVVLDRHGRLSREMNVFSDDAQTIVYRSNTDWQYVLCDLAARGIHSVLVEGGSLLLNHILSTGIYDELHVEVAPITIGEGVVAPKIDLPGTPSQVIDSRSLYEIRHQ